jgi:hypothetical protein
MIVVIVLIVGAFVLMAQTIAWMKYTGYGVAGATVVGMVVFYVVNKNRFPSATKTYIQDITSIMNSHTFKDHDYDDLTFDSQEKLVQSDIASDRVYDKISRIGSRNVVHGTFRKERFVAADLATYHRNGKQDEATFVGKYLSCFNKYSFDGRVIINLKGQKPVDLPDDIADLKLEKDEDGLAIYSTINLDYREVIDSLMLSKLRKIAIERHLVNINIVIWGGHSAAYLSFDDDTMVLPFDKEFKEDAQLQMNETILMVLDALHMLFKDKVIASKAASEIEESQEKEPEVPEVNQEETPATEVKEEETKSE